MNTTNYPLSSDNEQKNTIRKMLRKYFNDYTGQETDLYNNFGKYNGNIHELSSNFFAGIKVYPPLGFDPWPEYDYEELEKVKWLYKYCCEKRIPVTTHCSDGGFRVIDKKVALEYSNPLKWVDVLREFPTLKLNLAHFGKLSKTFFIYPDYSWQQTVVSLILKNNHVYADFSYNGVKESYYNSLMKLMNGLQEYERDKLKRRILFGSDFLINLLSIDSYNNYLSIYSRCLLTDKEKNQFAQTNPKHFLFK